jgi:hypothetical protein
MRRAVRFLIEAAGPAQPVRYDTPFSARLTARLILGFLSNELSNAQPIPLWLDSHRSEYHQ